MAHYRTGTINVTNGSTAVVGTGTDFINGAAIGECIQAPDGKLYEIASIQSATALTLGQFYLGSTVSGQTYSIVPTQSYIRDLAGQTATLVNGYSAVQSGAGAGKFSDGTLTIPGIRFTADEDTGVRRTGTNALAIVTAGTDRVLVSDVGAVTIPGTLTVSGVVTGPTAVAATNTTQLATTAHVFAERSNTATLTNKTLTNPVYSGVTANGGTITTIDINGGTIDGTTIGVTTPTTGSFTNVVVNSATGYAFQVTGNTVGTRAARVSKSSADASWSNAQMEIYTPAAATVDFSRIAFHVQDVSDAPQIGFDGTSIGMFNSAGTLRFGVGPTTGNVSITGDVTQTLGKSITTGGNLSISGEITQTLGKGFITGGDITVSSSNGLEGGQISLRNKANTLVTYSFDVDSADHGRLFTTVNNTNLTLGQVGGTGGAVALYTGGGERLFIDSAGSCYVRNALFVGTLAGAGEARLEVGSGRTGDGSAYVDLHASTGLDYSARMLRSGGVNGALGIENTGTGLITLSNNAAVRQQIDSTGRTSFTNSVGFGYGAGSGGTVTQVTSKSTSVTLNKASGTITMHNQSIAIGGSVAFIVVNSCFAQGDTVSLGLGLRSSVSSVNNYSFSWAAEGAGSFVIMVNNTSGSALAEAPVIAFNIIKGSAA